MAARIDIVKPDGSRLSAMQGKTVKLPPGKYTFVGTKSTVGVGVTTKSGWVWLEKPEETEFTYGPFDLLAGEYWIHNMSLKVELEEVVTPPASSTNALRVSIPYVHHVSVTGNTPRDKKNPWQDGSRGFNTAFLINTVGPVKFEGTEFIAVDDRRRIAWSNTALPATIESNTCLVLQRGKTYTCSSLTIKPGGMICCDGWNESAAYRAKIMAPAGISYLIEAKNNTVIAGLDFDSPETGPEKVGPDCILPDTGANVAVIGCRFYHVNYAVNGNRRPSGVFVSFCSAPDKSGVKSYFCWVEGNNWVITDCQVANSTREHCIRISGNADKVQIRKTDLINIAEDKSSVKKDLAKGTLVMQYCNRVYAYDLIVRGPIGTGPLAVNPADKEQRSSNIVVEDSNIVGVFEIHHGASNIRLTHLEMVSDSVSSITIDDYSEIFDRGTENVIIEDCIVDGRYFGVMNPKGPMSKETPTGFVRVGDRVKNITLRKNTFTNPYMRAGGWGSPSIVFIGKGVTSFNSVDNTWPMVAFLTVDKNGEGKYLSADEWTKYGADKIFSVAANS